MYWSLGVMLVSVRLEPFESKLALI